MSRLQVAVNRLPPDHPALSKIATIDLPKLPDSAQILYVPATVSHIYADILENLKRDRVQIQTVQSISELKFANNDYSDLGKELFGLPHSCNI